MPIPPSGPSGDVEWLGRPLPIAVRIVFIVLCGVVPFLCFFKQFAQRPDLTQIIQFGEIYQPRELPEIRQLKPDIHSLGGFDGQFYAQMALDPTLRRPDMAAALDDPAVRSQRAFLPLMAYILGGARPAAILFAYALLNLAFWYLLLALLAWVIPITSTRGCLAAAAILFSTGTLLSLEDALTDLPVATLGCLGLFVGEAPAAIFISLAILTKPTGGLFLLRYLTSSSPSTSGWKKRAGLVALALFPPVLWHLYLAGLFPGKLTYISQLGVPLQTWASHLVQTWKMFWHDPEPGLNKLPWHSVRFDFLALVSLTVQALFLMLRPRGRQAVWWVGLGFAGLFFCLDYRVAASAIDFTRTLLPLTFAFNLLLVDVRRDWAFLVLFLAGNAGLIQGVGETFRFLAG